MIPDTKKTPILEVEDIIIQRDGKMVLQIDHFEVEPGITLAIIGPNGAGKSTFLLALARLLKPVSGQMKFCGENLTTIHDLSYRRKISLVLQDPLLLDTTVFHNVAIGLKLRGISKKRVSSQVEFWLERLGIPHLRDRHASQLSGGEAQRVSLARAFSLNPQILYLDEPFGALDAPTRARLLDDFKTLIHDLDMTVIFVTHDMNEALLLGDQILVIVDGEVRQVGTPEMVFNNPNDVDVAGLVGVETVLTGQVIHVEDGRVVVDVCGIPIEAVGIARIEQEVVLLLRSEDITLWIGDKLPISSARNKLSGRVIKISPQGPMTRVVVSCEGKDDAHCVQVTALITRTSGIQMGLRVDQAISLTFKASAIHMLPCQ